MAIIERESKKPLNESDFEKKHSGERRGPSSALNNSKSPFSLYSALPLATPWSKRDKDTVKKALQVKKTHFNLCWQFHIFLTVLRYIPINFRPRFAVLPAIRWSVYCLRGIWYFEWDKNYMRLAFLLCFMYHLWKGWEWKGGQFVYSKICSTSYKNHK